MTVEGKKTDNKNIAGKANRNRLLSAMDKHGNNISAVSKELKMLSAYMRNIKNEGADKSITTVLDTKPEESEDTTTTDKFSQIDDFLSSTDSGELQTIDDILRGEQAAGDYFAALEYRESVNNEDIPPQVASINSFLDAVKNGEFAKMATSDGNMQETEDIAPDEDNLGNTFIDETFLTESLAKIYIKQRKYARALEIIRRLSLKYPEKNIYFADQIRFLEKLIINIKLK